MSDVVGGSGRRSLSVFLGAGLIGIGLGSILGGGTVYYFFVRKKLQELFHFQRSLGHELAGLKSEVTLLKQNTSDSTIVLKKPSDPLYADMSQHPQTTHERKLKSSIRESGQNNRRTVKFAGGYETADEEEYVTASDSELSDSEDDFLNANKKYGDLARRTTGSENLINGDAEGIRKDKSKVTSEDVLVQFLKKVDLLFEGDNTSQNEAYSSLKINEHKLSHSFEFWWRLAKATHLKATTEGNEGRKDAKKKLAFEACEYSDKALELNPNSADVHKWYAITLGSKGEFVGTNEKISNGYKFKEHIDRAIAISPSDSTLHYLLGRFCYEISQLSWIERSVASTLFSTPPSSSYEEALRHFESSENIGKPFKDSRLFIAKCYIGIGDYQNAAQWLELAESLPVNTPTDVGAQEEINSLLQKYRRYI